jgi:hypothetical protein
MPPTVPAALNVPEQQIWTRYAERLAELRADPRAAAVLQRYRLAELAPGTPAGARLADLAAAVHHLENALDPGRAPLPDIALMEPDDVARHPGFDGVEDEVVAEEDYLLALRQAIGVG